MQGERITPKSVGGTFGFIYLYMALHCPMEQITGRKSLKNDFAAGFTVGYLGVSRGLIGLPFGGSNVVWQAANKGIPIPVIGGALYGAIATAFGMFNGRDF